MKLRIVKARTATPEEFRAAAERIPSPNRDRMEEALNSPSAFNKQIAEQEGKLRQRDLPATPVRGTDAPAPPNMADYIAPQRERVKPVQVGYEQPKP